MQIMKIIDGKQIANSIQLDIKKALSQSARRRPCLAVVLVGENPASVIYVGRKVKACEEIGIVSLKRQFPATLSQEALVSEIDALNANAEVDGILVQLPLPNHINPFHIIQRIHPSKDVDGLHPENAGKLLCGDPSAFIPCTPLGIKVLLEHSGIEVAGKHAVVLGRSNLVGKPMAAILMQNGPGGNATVTVAHSKTKDIKKVCLTADILIAAIGQPHFVTHDMVREGVVIVDVGINKIEDAAAASGYRLVGDVDFNSVKGKCAAITPVPGGVGPMTIAMLMSNTLKAYT